jgi:hypothetical protein
MKKINTTKKYLFRISKITAIYYLIITNIYANSNWLLWWIWSTSRIREWDLHTEDIPKVIKYLIDTFLGIAWTVAVLFVIVWAYKLLFGSLKSDHTKWRETIIMALTWFAISALAWFIVKFIFHNFG